MLQTCLKWKSQFSHSLAKKNTSSINNRYHISIKKFSTANKWIYYMQKNSTVRSSQKLIKSFKDLHKIHYITPFNFKSQLNQLTPSFSSDFARTSAPFFWLTKIITGGSMPSFKIATSFFLQRNTSRCTVIRMLNFGWILILITMFYIFQW